jgi:hypothetical protein
MCYLRELNIVNKIKWGDVEGTSGLQQEKEPPSSGLEAVLGIGTPREAAKTHLAP